MAFKTFGNKFLKARAKLKFKITFKLIQSWKSSMFLMPKRRPIHTGFTKTLFFCMIFCIMSPSYINILHEVILNDKEQDVIPSPEPPINPTLLLFVRCKCCLHWLYHSTKFKPFAEDGGKPQLRE